MRFPTFKNELKCIEDGFLVVGCDEVGRGPLAGPVVACACVLDHSSINDEEDRWHARVRDSKTISEKEREELCAKIMQNSLAWGIGEVWQEEIDEINIHNATLLAMKRAVEALLAKVDKAEKYFIFIDGRFKIPDLLHQQKTIVKGDAEVLSIAAASIIAKVHRDNIMKKFDVEFPQYGFRNHKGYGTKEHQNALKKWGPVALHRRTFLKAQKFGTI